MAIVKVPSESDEECLNFVNECDFGLRSRIFTGDVSKRLETGRELVTGLLTENDC